MSSTGVVAGSRRRLTLSPLQLRLASAGLWSLAGAFVSRVLGLLASIIIARTLGSVVFGELGIIQSTTGMFAVLGAFGLAETGTKHVAELREKDPARSGRVIGLSTLVGLLGGALAAALLAVFSNRLAVALAAPHLATLLAYSSLLLLLAALAAAQSGALAGFEAFKQLARINTVVAIVSFPVFVCGGYFAGLRGCVLALILTAATNCFLSFRAVRTEAMRRQIRIVYSSLRSEFPILWKFSLPAVLTGVLVMPTYWVCNAILAHQPNGYAELGLFNAASAWRSAILFLPGLLGPLLLPFSSSLASEGHEAESRQVCRTGLVVNTCTAVAVALPVVLLAGSIMRMYGPQYESGSKLLVLLAILAVVMAATGALWNTLMGWGAVWLPFGVSLFWSGAMIGGTWLFRGLGAEGLAWSSLIAHLLQLAGYLVCLGVLMRRRELAVER